MKIKISYFHIDNMSLAFSEINSNDNLIGGDNMNEFEKKRQTRHNITIKKRNTQSSGSGGSDDNGNVQSMLKLINNTNGYDDTNDESGGLADFNPPPRAEVSSKTPQQQQQQQPNEVTVDYEKPTQINIKKENNDAVQNIATAVNPRQYPMPLDGQNDFASLPKTYASDYYKQYVPYFNSRPENSNNYSMPNTKDQLLEKLNYMIHLLEEQKDEKTGHVMEEVILYSFLGVFIIFIVDSFSRGGKYTR